MSKLSILKHLPIMLALCQHNTLAYYAFYYAGIFDAGLESTRPFSFYVKHVSLRPNDGTTYCQASLQQISGLKKLKNSISC